MLNTRKIKYFWTDRLACLRRLHDLLIVLFFPFCEWKKHASYILVSVLLKSNNSTTLGCHTASIKNANIFVQRILRNWRLIIIFNSAHETWYFPHDRSSGHDEGPVVWKEWFYHRPKAILLNFKQNLNNSETINISREQTQRGNKSMIFRRNPKGNCFKQFL